MLILGITGGVATGKSTVTQMLADRGTCTISADTISHALLQPGTDTTRAVLQAFPSCAEPDDPQSLTIDRRALGQLVFADSDARKQLEALTHPPIIAALNQQIEAWRHDSSAPLAAAEIPLLFEAGLENLTDRIVVVTCTSEIQIQRLAARLNGDLAEAENRVKAQWPMEEKLARADAIIHTDQGLEETRGQVDALFDALMAQQV